MDKNTLSNYGWIVIAVLVLSVMIALATPFGSYIEQGIKNTKIRHCTLPNRKYFVPLRADICEYEIL